MTAQFGDQIRFEGKWHTLFSNPLEALFKAGFPRPYTILQGQGNVTANWRDYIASWEIRDDQLFLLDLLGKIPGQRSTGALEELFDPKGSPRPLCSYCRKPFEQGVLGRWWYVAPFVCPHCGSFQHWRTCKNCSRKCDLTAAFCPRCGTSLGTWQCTNCHGTATDWMESRPPLPPPGAFCIHCGIRVQTRDEKEADVSKEDAGPVIPPVKATWYTGVLQIPLGERLEYTHAEYASTYEQDILLHVQEGRLIRKEIRNNRTPELMARLKAQKERRRKLRAERFLLRFVEKRPSFGDAKRTKKICRKDPKPCTTPPMLASELPETPSGEPWNVPVEGPMKTFLGRQFTADELYRADDLDEPEGCFRFVRAFEVLPLIGTPFTLKGDKELSSAVTTLLKSKLPNITWEGINIPKGPLRKSLLVHASIPAPIDEATRQPMIIEIYGHVVKVQGFPFDSVEGMAWRKKRSEELEMVYRNPKLSMPELNTPMEIEMKAAIYANIRYPSVGMPFYL